MFGERRVNGGGGKSGTNIRIRNKIERTDKPVIETNMVLDLRNR